jgi:hypothetical protein
MVCSPIASVTSLKAASSSQAAFSLVMPVHIRSCCSLPIQSRKFQQLTVRNQYAPSNSPYADLLCGDQAVKCAFRQTDQASRCAFAVKQSGHRRTSEIGGF